MIQNLLALTIVFSAAGYTVFSMIKNLIAKKTTKCDGCPGCSLKELPMAKSPKILQANRYSM